MHLSELEGDLAALFTPHTLQDHAMVAQLLVEDSIRGQEVDGLVGRERIILPRSSLRPFVSTTSWMT